MKKLFSFFVFLISISLFPYGGPRGSSAPLNRIIDFELKDQFDRTYRDEDYLGNTFLVIGSDKKGREFNPKWALAIKRSLESNSRFKDIKILRLANMKGVPRFIRKMVTGKFPKEKSEWVALDWDGIFAKSYAWHKHVSNIMVFDKEGKLIYQTTGEKPEGHKVDKIKGIILKSPK